jgi:hypothetical protein
VQRIVANDDPTCINVNQPQSFQQSMRLGEVLKYVLSCDPVKVVVSTDRGESIYTFE